jgi:hypothetical protein
LHQSNSGKITGVATAPPAVITNHCQSEPQPSSGFAAASAAAKCQRGTHGAGDAPRTKLRERQSRKIKSRCR